MISFLYQALVKNNLGIILMASSGIVEAYGSKEAADEAERVTFEGYRGDYHSMDIMVIALSAPDGIRIQVLPGGPQKFLRDNLGRD